MPGYLAPGFEPVGAAFEAAFAGKPDMGGALAVRHRGVPVVDLWGGIADARTGDPWREDTVSVIFSCTKGLVSILAARLVQEGLLDYDERVATYWPKFAAAGKGEVRVHDLLAHRSGLSAPRTPMSAAQITDWSSVVTQLAEQQPLWEPGSGWAYHAITHGWLAGEVIRRITGMSLGAYFAEVVARPLVADAWIGVPPAEEDRVAHLEVGESLAELTRLQAAARTPGVVDWGELAMTLGGALPHELIGADSGWNSPEIRRAEIPGAGGIASARALAAIWSATIVETDGVRLLDDEVLRAATEPQSEGPPVFEVPGPWPRWGMGFQLPSEPRRYLTDSGFGHDGAGGQSAFADPDTGIGFAYLTNQLEGIGDVRATRIIDALRDVVAD